MPTKVRLASGLMWLIWAAGVMYLLGAWLEVIRSALPGATMLGIVYVIVLGASALLIRAVSLGRNWARLTYSTLAVIAVASIVREYFHGVLTPVQLLTAAALVIAYSTILVFLFHSSSAPWFDKSRRNAA